MSENAVTISRIELVSPRRKIYALHDHQQFLCEVSENTLVHFGLYKGTSLSAAQYEALVAYQEFDDGLQQALRYLKNRPHLRGELKTKLYQKQFRKQVVEKVLQYLEDKNYINDAGYVQRFTAEAIRAAKWGPLGIRRKLMQKGAPHALIDEALLDYTEEKQREACRHLAQKKLRLLQDQPAGESRKKVTAFLLQRGFYHGTIESVLNGITP